MHHWRIRSYLFLLVIVIALPFIALIAITVYLNLQDDRTQAQESSLHLASLVAADTSRLINDAEISLAPMAQRPLVRAMDPARCDPFLSDFRDLHPQYADLAVVNIAGRVICSNVPQSTDTIPFTGQAEIFQNMAQTDGPVFGPPFIGTIAGKWMTVLWFPVHDASGKFVGALGLPFDLAQFQSSLEPAVVEGTSVTIIDAQGNAIARAPDPGDWVGQNVRGKEIVDLALATPSGTTIANDSDGKERVYGFAIVPSANWRVYVGTYSEVAFANARAAQSRNTDFIVLTVALGLLFAMAVSMRIADPITELANGARAVAQGNMDARMPLTGPREIYEVAAEFNMMLDANQRAQKAIAARELEQAAIAELGMRALSSTNLQKLFDDATQLVANVLGVEFSEILEVLPGKKALLLRAGAGFEEELIGHAVADAGNASQAAFTLLSNKPVRVVDLEHETRFVGASLLRAHNIVSGASVVIRGYQEPYGILGAHSPRRIEFTREDIHFLQSVANVLTTAIERKRTEENYRNIFENSIEGIFQSSPEERFLSVNPAMARIYGYASPQEMIAGATSIPSNIYTNSDDRNEFMRQMETQGQVRDFIAQNQRRDGSTVWTAMNARVVRDAAGAVQYYEGFIQDITERKRAEEAFKDSAERFRLLASATFEGIGFSEQGKIVEANEQLAQMLGCTPTELIGRPVLDFVAPESRALVAARRQQPVEGSYQYQALRKDGSTFPIEVQTKTIQHGEKTIRVTAMRDITERRRAEEDREQFVKELQTLSRRMVELEETQRRHLAQELHDQVGQTLTALSLNLNLIKSQVKKKSVGKVVTRLNDSLQLVEQTVQLIRNVMADLRPSVLDDYGLFAALEWYGKHFERRTQIRVRVKGNELAPRLSLGTETVLFRIAQEALTNVAKHARAQSVTVSLEETDAALRMIISDDGAGFAIVPPSASTPASMGLWTMRERALSIHGELRIESAPGRGTRVIAQVERET